MLCKSKSKTFNDNQLPKNDLNNDQGISIDNKFKRLDQKIDYIYKTMDQKIDRIYTSTSDNNGILQDIYTDGIPCNK